jgi:hypothetical protein
MPIQVFTMLRCCCSRWSDLGVHDGPKPAFGLEFAGPAGADGTWQVRVVIGGDYDSTAIGEIHVVLPVDVQYVSGDTLIRTLVVPDARRRFALVVRPRGLGVHTISAVVKVTGPGMGADETEVELSGTVTQDSTVLGACRVVRQETVHGTQRYRYAGEYLVPIDQPERFTEDDILGASGRPRIIRQVAAACSKSSSQTQATMRWVVFVGRHGEVVDARPLDATGASSETVSAARAALAGWVFTPAQLRGQAVRDWIVVQVPISR